MDEEEFNQFDEIPPFATCELSRLTVNDKTLYLRTDHNEKICVRSKSGCGRGLARGRGRGRGRKETSVMYINCCLNFDVPNWMVFLNSM